MKAIVLKKFGRSAQAFRMETREIPTPAAGEICVKAEASGLNFADVMARQGLYQDCPKLPTVLGYEVVGRIHSVGSAITDLKVGQRVLAMTRFGGYAEYAVADRRGVVVIPDTWDAARSTALAVQFGTAYYAAEQMVQLQAGDHVLVQAAAGGVGTALVQYAKHKGCIVYGTAGSAKKLEYLRSCGVDYPINYRTTRFDTYIREQVGARGVDVVFDSLGGKALQRGYKLLGSGGRLVGYGAAAMSGNRNPIKLLRVALGFGLYSPIPMLTTSKSLLGVNMLRIADDRPEQIQRCFEAVIEHTKAGVFSPVLNASFPASEIVEAHEYLTQRKSIGKVAITWND